jgi:GH25 family lysozyme M1 (1,4-beta-N-acetylmuramidase)
MVFQLKTPVVYDVAADDIGSLLTAPVPYGVYVRASVGYFTDYSHPWQFHSAGRDATFQQVYQDSRLRQYRIGPYHYFVQGGVAAQAQCLIDYMKEIGVSDPSGRYNAEFNPVLDVELECSGAAMVGKPYADMLYQWIDMVEQAMQAPVDIYTAKPQWAYVLASGLAPAWIKGRRVWAKFYPYDDYIDRNADFPLSYLPAGWTYDQLAFWQYCDHGRSAGYACNDLNKVTAAGQAYYDAKFPSPETPPPTPNRITVPIPAPGNLAVVDDKGIVFTGTPAQVQTKFFPPTPEPDPEPTDWMTVAPLVVSRTQVFLHNGREDKVQQFVLTVDPVRSVSYPHAWMLKNHCLYATNGGAGWNATTVFGQFRFEGSGFGTLGRDLGQVYVDKNGHMSLQRPSPVWTTFPFTNLLVYNRALPPLDKAVDYRARTAIGQKEDGTILIVTVTGGDHTGSHGMSFQEMAQLMQDLGCVFAVMVDGGGSSAMAYNDNGKAAYLMTNDAAEDTVVLNGVTYKLRAAAGHLGVCPR